ncbi:hypothetical protein glysoja_046030, partial [Glycine soja]
ETNCSFGKASDFWCKLGYDCFFLEEVEGHMGGIWVLAKKQRNLTLSLVESNNRAITFQISLGGFNWLCSTVYARPNLAASYKLWEYLMRFKASISIP